MKIIFSHFLISLWCLLCLVSCGGSSSKDEKSSTTFETVNQDQLAKNCLIKFSKTDQLNDVAVKSFLMKSECQLSENQVLKELKKI